MGSWDRGALRDSATRPRLTTQPKDTAPGNMTDLRSNFLPSSAAARGAWREPIRPRAIVLLAGSVGASSLASQIGRSVLDLPLGKSFRLLDLWRRRISEFLRSGEDSSDAEVLLLGGESSPLPAVLPAVEGLRLRAERDSGAYRGTAGALRDLCDGFRDADHILVGNASQCPGEGQLLQFVAESSPAEGVTVGADRDGAPSGLLLVRCDALREIPPVGYVDLKEQALPRIAQKYGARVVVSPGGGAPPIRSLKNYLESVRCWHLHASLADPRARSPFEERWVPTFSIVEEGADVADTAQLYDSVVLAGGVVRHGCSVVRSVVGPGGVVRRTGLILDQLVLGASGGLEGGSRLGGGATR